MLYILPPPRAPNPPSPWDSIMCSGSSGTAAAQNADKTWGGGGGSVGVGGGKRPPPRVKLRKLHFKNDDSTSGVGDEVDMGRNSKSLSECYFAGKGTAVVLPAASEAQKSNRRSGAGSNIQKHLQSMFYLLRPEETLKMAVKLESVHPVRTRYLVVVSRMGARAEESCLLGIDCNEKTTVGLVLKVLADTSITLDGDGGFSVSVCGRHHIFKPVSVQAMWSALQTLHKVSSKAREQNYFQGGLTHAWVNYYEERIESDRSCLNEWHAMDNLESRRPPSPDSIRTKPTEREETEKVIRSTLKEIMMSVDLDEVTSKYIRSRLEEDLDMDLGEYKSFIDQEMLTILGQMDAPTEIFDHVYLGSEWNASNYEELQRNGVGHILNVTREIDNFFPGTFDYLNVRVYDDEKTDLLKHWDNTYKYISKAKKQGSKVLVHCKMGVSRSASVVIAYAMKAFDWDFKKAMHHVKDKRSCIKPNTSFISQLETYQGMLDAMKNKEKLQRSKSETSLKSPMMSTKSELILAGSEPTPIIQSLTASNNLQTTMSGQDLRSVGSRPKSWSPDNTISNGLMSESKSPQGFRSMENLNQQTVSREYFESLKKCVKNNGESYSVSPNQIMHIHNGNVDNEQSLASVKDRVNELESKKAEKNKLVLNLLPQFESSNKTNIEVDSSLNQETKTKLITPKISKVLTKTETWDPGEKTLNQSTNSNGTINDCDLNYSASDEKTIQTAGNTVPEVQLRSKITRKDGDLFSNQLDRVFDREERKQQRVTVIQADCNDDAPRNCPSRQSSWSSYDSAVVLGYQGETRDVPSRHSSWGSGDTRTLPSRNSSWGSYDVRTGCTDKNSTESHSCGIFPYDKEDIPWHPGTVRRTKQKLEESSCRQAQKSSSETLHEFNGGIVEAVNSTLIQDHNCSINISCAINTPDIDIIDKVDSRLSVSAPENSSMELISQDNCSLSKSTSSIDSSKAQYSSVKQYKTFLESQPKDISRKEDFLDLETNSGLVKNLKKEFEAKTTIDRVNQMNLYNTDNTEEKKNRVNSLPSSPTSLHSNKGTSSPTSSDPGEDLNFKDLIGKFENREGPVTHRQKGVKTFKNSRYSCFEVSMEKNPVKFNQTPLIANYNNKAGSNRTADGNNEFKRPPMSPGVRNAATNVVTTVIAKATKKQQQFGKSHPLARLSIKPRHNNAVYNTM